MNKRHHDHLLDRLDQLYLTHTTHITYNELYLWSGRERLTKATYQEIYELWVELLIEKNWIEESEQELRVAVIDSGISLFWLAQTNSFNGWSP